MAVSADLLVSRKTVHIFQGRKSPMVERNTNHLHCSHWSRNHCVNFQSLQSDANIIEIINMLTN